MKQFVMLTRQSPAKCLSILGTGSDVGKSIVVSALCRIFNDLGFSVAPFKAQNMSNNSSVTQDGGEMGRAQVVQAQAARIKPHVDMNPVLLKPDSQSGSQVILQGKPLFNIKAREYYRNTDFLFEKSGESLQRLRDQYELIVMEGAGSCAEVNLMSRDFVNFRTARKAKAPVILVADIDRGGVFAQIIGTLAVIPEEDKKSVRGIIINRFRGDPSLFDEGITYLEKTTALPILGLIPHFTHIKIDSEDSVPLETQLDPELGPIPHKINIAVLRLPYISNFTDFSPLDYDSQVNLHYLSLPRSLDGYQIVILPGTKNVRNDMVWLNRTGWSSHLHHYVRQGGELAGICGGYQMLGRKIHDPEGVEGKPGETEGLGLLDVETVMKAEKTLTRSAGIWQANNKMVEGYEIHMGVTERPEHLLPLIKLKSRNGKPVDEYDGAISADGKIWGTYFHGLFNTPNFRTSFLKKLNPDYHPASSGEATSGISEFRNKQYNLLANHFRSYLNLEKLLEITGLN